MGRNAAWFEFWHVGEVDGGGVAACEEGWGCVEGAGGAVRECFSDGVRRIGGRARSTCLRSWGNMDCRYEWYWQLD